MIAANSSHKIQNTQKTTTALEVMALRQSESARHGFLKTTEVFGKVGDESVAPNDEDKYNSFLTSGRGRTETFVSNVERVKVS